MNDYVKNVRWSTSTGLAFWGTTVQVAGFLIATTLLLYLCYNIYDILLSAFLPYEVSVDFDHFEYIRKSYLDWSIGCLVVAGIAYILYLVGICLWKGDQRSIKSDMHVRDIIIAEFIMPVEALIIYLIFRYSPEKIKDFDSGFPIMLVAWAAMIVGEIILIVQYNSLSKEETWSEKAREGAKNLKFSYACALWIQAVLIFGTGLISLAVYSTISKFQSGFIDKYGNTLQGIGSVAQEMQNLVGTIKVLMMFTCIIIFVLAVILTIYRIMGWYKIKSGGNEEIHAHQELTVMSSATRGSNRFCHKCGTELPEGSSFCPSCGVAVAVINVVDSPTQKEDEPQVMEQESLTEYEEEEQDNKKKWMLWGGIAVGIVAIVAIILALWDSSDKMEPNAKVFADRSVVFKSIESGVGIEPIAELTYAADVESRQSEYDKDGIWTEIIFEKDGKSTKGYMAKGDIMNLEDFSMLQNGGMNDPDLKGGLPINIERLALLSALKSAGSDWHLEGVNLYGERQSNSKRLTVRGVSPSEDCLGFILSNNTTGERKFFLYSTPDIYSPGNMREPVYLYSETVKGGDVIYDVNYYKKKGERYEVIYVSNSEQDNSDDFLYEGSAIDEEEEVVENETQFGGTVEMSGLVDGKYPVKMTLTMHPDNTVSGTVTYVKYNVPMGLSGTYTDRGGSYDLSLDETSDGEVTGNFIGSYDGLVFSGTWVKADGSKEMPFRVER